MKKNSILLFSFILLGVLFIGNNVSACSGGQCSVNGYCVNSGQVYNGKICNNGVIENITVSPTPTTCPSPKCIYNNTCYSSGSTIYLNGKTFSCSSGNVVEIATNPTAQCSLPSCKYADGVCAAQGSKALYGGNCYSCSNGAINNVPYSNCSTIVSGGSSAPAICTYVSAVTAWTDCVNGISSAASGGLTYATNPSLYDSDPACVDVPTSRVCATAPSGLTAVCSPTGTSSVLSWSPIANASYAIKIDKQDLPTDLWKNDCTVSQYDGDICVNPQADYSGIQWGFGGVKTVSGDYDGDGKSDLAVWDPVGGNWYIRPVSGTTIAWAVQYGGSTMIPVPGDYNNDGKSDLALWNSIDGKWYIRTVSGTSILWASVYGTSTTLIPVPGDYSGDGKSDLALWNPTDGKWYIKTVGGTILANGIQFGSLGMIPVSGDYDGDGKSDLALWNPTDGNWYIRTVSGASIAWAVQYGSSGMKPASGDYDGDGKSDLAVWNPTDGKWYIRDISGNNIAWGVQFGSSTMIPVPGDYNGDGKSDLALWNQSSTYSWYIKDAPDMQNNFSFQSVNNYLYKWWLQSIVNGVSSDFVSGPDFTCGSTCSKFRLTQAAGTYSQLDSICKTNYGSDWEFATLTDADEDYIMYGNNGSSIFPAGSSFVIKNAPLSISEPFVSNGKNDVCPKEWVDPINGNWPQSGKMAMFGMSSNWTKTDLGSGNMPFCYSDVHYESNGPFTGLCRKTNADSINQCESCVGYNPNITVPLPLPRALGFSVPNLVAYYSFDAGNTNDDLGAKNLTKNGPTFSTASVSTDFGKSVYFEGVNDYLSLSNSSNYISGGNYSTCLWYKQTVNQPMQELISGREGSLSWNGFELQTDEYNHNMRAGDGGGSLAKSPIPSYGSWQHICFTKDGTVGKLYLNGEEVASANNLIAGINPFPSTLLIGKDAYSFGVSSFEYFKGYMDDLSFFNRALTPCEVLRLAKGPKACANGQICSTGHLSASCSFSPNSALINETVTLTATTTGALGSTTFSWSGTSLTGKNTRIATTSYSIEGTYYASTTVSDGFSTTTVGCLSEIGSDQEIIITPLVYSGVCSLLTVDRCQVGTSTNSTHTENSYGTNYDWICLGSDPLRTTDDVPCHSFYPNSDAAFDCNVSMTNPSTGSVNINTNTTWTVTPKTSNPDWSTYDKDWTLSDHNNENIFIGSSESGSNTFDYIFNTVGLKTIGASVRGGNMCTSTVTIVQQGGHGREI